MYRDATDIGLLTTAKTRMEYLYALRSLVNLGSLSWHEPFFAGDPDRAIPAKEELVAQMRRTRVVLITTSRPGAAATERFAWEAKIDAEGKRSPELRDDLLIALMMCAYLLYEVEAGRSHIPAFITARHLTQRATRVTRRHTRPMGAVRLARGTIGATGAAEAHKRQRLATAGRPPQ